MFEGGIDEAHPLLPRIMSRNEMSLGSSNSDTDNESIVTIDSNTTWKETEEKWYYDSDDNQERCLA